MAFSGKVVLITGGGSGMGRCAARKLARDGANVALFDVNEDGMAETAEGSERIRAWPVDMTDFDAVRGATDEVTAQLGPIDRVYNAAAIMPFGPVLEMPPASIHRLMTINYGGLVNVAHAVLPAMVQRGRGDFISFASMAGIIPTLKTGAYSATKAAVAFLTETLYHENRDSGVRFACVCPPPVATPLLQQGRDTVWPKMLDQTGAPMAPEDVIADIERALEKGEFWVFPGKGTRMGYVMRRLAPGLVWKQVHKVEGQ